MLEVRNLTKIYKTKKAADVKALDKVSIKFNETGMVFLLGKSGSGKSTLLNVMGGLDKFESGEIIIKGKSSKNFKAADFDSYRNTFLGFIFQEYNVLPEFTVQKNIALALELQGKKSDKKSVDELLKQVDLQGYAKRKPNQLSGGQKQRIAIARALIKNPQIIMADEPTGALDSNTGKQVFDTLKKLSETKLVIVVSHDREFAEIYADRIIEMKDGHIISDVTKRKKPPQNISNGFKVVGKNMIHIEKNHKFTSTEAKYLNDIVMQSGADIFISADENVNQNIKKIAKIDDEGNSEFFDNTNSEDISKKVYSGKDLKLIKSKLKFKDSFKMGASGLKTKKVRLVFTILLSAIALAMFGLADTMASFNVAKSNYESLKNMNVESITIGKTHVNVEDGYVSRESAKVTDEDLNTLKTKFKDYNFTPKYDLEINVDSYLYNEIKDVYYKSQVEGAYELNADDLSLYNLSLYPNNSTGKYPTNNNEVAITKFQFDMLKQFSIRYNNGSGTSKYEITDVNSLLNLEPEFTINGKNFKVVGVIDTKFDTTKYEKLKNFNYNNLYNDMTTMMLYSEYDTMLQYGFHNSLFFKKDAYRSTIKKEPINYYDYQFYIDATNESNYYYYYGNNGGDLVNNGSVVLYNSSATMGEKDVIINGTVTFNENGDNFENISINDRYFYPNGYANDGVRIYYIYYDGKNYYDNFEGYKDYIISQDDYYGGEIADFKAEVGKKFGNSKKSLTLKESYNSDSNTESYNVIGVYFDFLDYPSLKAYKDENDYYRYVSGAIYFKDNNSVPKYLKHLFGEYDSLVTKLLNNRSKDFELVKYLSGYDSKVDCMVIKSQVSGILENFVEMIQQMAKIFLYVGIGFAVFSALLLMNFIAVSISYKKKEIGILRALGARGSDVYGIFFNESLIITFINYLVSIAMTIGAVIAINITMRKELGFYLSLLSFGIRQILLVALVSFLVAVIASFLPTHRISKMKPIDAIQERK